MSTATMNGNGTRVCAHDGCDTHLSAYNEDPYCAVHLPAEEDDQTESVCGFEDCYRKPFGGCDYCRDHAGGVTREERVEAAAGMRRAGLTTEEIGRRLEVSPFTAGVYLMETGTTQLPTLKQQERRKRPAQTAPVSTEVAEGIDLRHQRRCAVKQGDSCDCAPTYQAHVWDAKNEKRLRRTFPSQDAAQAWREEMYATFARIAAEPEPTARDRYLKILLDHAETSIDPDDALFDRIERVMGLA